MSLILHGYFSATHIGPARLHVQIARLLAGIGYVVWRFDCWGVGDSDGELRDASYWTELDDYKQILSEALIEDDVSEILLVGHCSGASLATRIAAADRRIGALLLLSPALGKVTWPDRLFSEQSLADLACGRDTLRRGALVDRQFYGDVQKEDVLDVCRSVTASTTVCYALDDRYYGLDSMQRTVAALKAEYFFKLADADHNFTTGDSRMRLLDLLKSHIPIWRRMPRPGDPPRG